jgi:hypothetical protein
MIILQSNFAFLGDAAQLPITFKIAKFIIFRTSCKKNTAAQIDASALIHYINQPWASSKRILR